MDNRYLSPILFFLGFILLAISAYFYSTRPTYENLIIDDPQRVMGTVEAGKELVISFRFRNTGRETIRIVGLAPC